MNKWSCVQLFRHYKSLPFHTVIRIHLILLSYHILVILPSQFSSMEQMLMLYHVTASIADSPIRPSKRSKLTARCLSRNFAVMFAIGLSVNQLKYKTCLR